ncbi:ATP-binding protein [Kitasatospora sp. NPDC051853]|uniref:ATP-binding protein n=1 Tax=Kitasatospora sp. NPDC051853 TaxID=3364058 RepID=UPI003793B95A
MPPTSPADLRTTAPRPATAGPESHTHRLAPDDHAPLRLRKWLVRHLRQWRLVHLADDLQLIATELATNAARHGVAPATATLTRGTAGQVRLAVTDTGPGFDPEEVTASWEASGTADSCHGRGLLLVAALSTAWGTDRPRRGGHRVWAELAAP